MSNSVAGGCLVHYNDQHIQVRRDFFDLCAYNKADFNQGVTKNGKKANDEPNQECMAKILRLFETLTNHEKLQWHLKAERLKAKGLKPPAEPREHRIELAYSTITTLLYGTYGESTVRKSIAVLLQRGYIKRYQQTHNSVPCYVLNIKVLQAALDKQAQEAIADTMEESEVSNLTSENSEVSNLTPSDFEPSNLTANGPNLTPESPSEIFEMLNLTPNNIRDKKDFEKEDKKEKRATVQEPPTSSIPSDSFSLPLSQKIEEETKPTEVDYPLFDRLCHEKGYAANFMVPRNDKNNAAIQELRSQNATVEQVEFVFNDIWNDKDPFWQQHRGKLSTVASQFTARLWKMSAPATKRQTLTGTPNYTEDRIGQAAQEAKPAPILHIVKPEPQPTYGPKQDQAPTYTRLEMKKPARARSLEARLRQEQKNS